MSSKSKSSKRAQEEDPEVDDEVPAPAAAKKKDAPAKKKKKPDPEPVEEDVDMEEPEEEAVDEELLAKRKATLTKKRKKAKLVGYRSLSKTAGFMANTEKGEVLPSSVDCLSSLLSVADAKRLMRFVPATPGAPGFDASEFDQRMELFKQSVPASAARETQARCDAAMRAAMNQAVIRAVESGKKTISPSMMAAVLRPYAANMEFTSVTPPIGLIRFAQNSGVLNVPESDQNKTADEKKVCTSNKKKYQEFIESEERRKAKAKADRAAKKEKAMKDAAAAEAQVAAS